MAGNWNLQRVPIKLRLRMFLVSVVFLMLLGSLLSLWQFRNVSDHAARVSHAEQRITSLLKLNNDLITLMSQLHRAAEDQDAARFEKEAQRLLGAFRQQLENAKRGLQEIGRESERYGVLVSAIESMLDGLPERIASF